MAFNKEFAGYIEEQLAPLGFLSTSHFFGGRAFKYHDRLFAWINGSTLYLRADAASRAAFEAHGAGPFKYSTRKGEVTTHKFYSAPEFLLDDPEQLLAWSRRAIQAAA